MNTPPEVPPELSADLRRIAPANISATRPVYWSVRRELWENRSICIGPLAVAVVFLVGFSISLIGLPRNMRALAALDRAHRPAMLAMQYSHAAWLLILTAFLVGVFYSLDALHGERRDRSILFWKSLPVSDLMTVLSKASIPLVVLPILIFALIVIVQLIMLLLSIAVVLINGLSVATFWTELPLFQLELVVLYGVTVLALWHAPIYGWLLLISGWARRTTALWAVLPLIAANILERVAFHTSHFESIQRDRLFGWAAAAFAFKTKSNVPVDPHLIPLTQLTPGRFLSTPGLWAGLLFAAICFAAATRLRRYREPI